MKYMYIIAIISITICILIKIAITIIDISRKKQADAKVHYRKRELLTENEYNFFQKIKPIAQKIILLF